MSAWDLLKAEFATVSASRPAGSLTVMEFVEKTNYSFSHASRILREKEIEGKLQAFEYKTPSGRRAKCYVVRRDADDKTTKLGRGRQR
jgi:hypothetical protein